MVGAGREVMQGPGSPPKRLRMQGLGDTTVSDLGFRI